MHGLLHNLYEDMSQMCKPISDVALPLAALGALFFIAYRVWQSMARGEPIDVFGLLRPFVLGICILFFDTMVLGTINGIFHPIVEGTGAMLRDQQFSVREYQKEKDKLENKARLYNILSGGSYVRNKEFDNEIKQFDWSEQDYATMENMYYTINVFSLDGLIQMAMRKVVEVIFLGASLVVDTIRTFFLVVLSILGPLAFAISVFDGFHNTLIQWLARYISVYLWLPVADLFGAMLTKIQGLIIQNEIKNMMNPLAIFHMDGSGAIYIIFMIIGIVGYFCIPTVSNWIVQAGGMSAYNRNVNNTVNKAGNVVGAAAGASTGNVSAVLLKK